MKKTVIVMVAVTMLVCLFFAGCRDKDDGKIPENTSHTTKAPANTTVRDNTTHNNTTHPTNNAGGMVSDVVTDVSDVVSDVVGGVERGVTDVGRGLERGAENIMNR